MSSNNWTLEPMTDKPFSVETKDSQHPAFERTSLVPGTYLEWDDLSDAEKAKLRRPTPATRIG